MLQGIGVTKAIAIGKAFVLQEHTAQNAPQKAQDVEADIQKLHEAVAASMRQVSDILHRADEEAAAILGSHLTFLEDPSFNAEAAARIRESGDSAHRVVEQTTAQLHEMFSGFDDSYMRERAADILDVGGRILANLSGEVADPLASLAPGTIVVAQDLAPSQTAQLDRENTLGFVTQLGGKTSHTAIMAKAMQIAAVVGCRGVMDAVQDGDTLVVNAVKGEVCVNPDEQTLHYYQQLQADHEAYLRMVNTAKDWTLYKQNGERIWVAANIGTPGEARAAKENGADGVGLFRTEFLYMDRSDMPTEEEQYEAYRSVAETFGDAPVIIRTLDVGGDKQLPYLDIPTEENPFLGVRAIRLCMKHGDLFRTQLRAVLRAAQCGNLKLMFPMIGHLHELREAKALLEQCKTQLAAEGIPFKADIEVGMMIEIPAAAVMADDFAKEVDFFSIGTNDLTQYTLAVDRGNPELNALYDSLHPSVLWLIQNTIEAAHRNNILCCMCGEMAGDEQAVPILAGYGLDEYSVGVAAIGQAKVTLLAQPGVNSPDSGQ